MSTQTTRPATPAEHGSDLSFLLERLLSEWRHSREEDTGGVHVYRPEDFPFPPSFGRDGFELARSGRYIAHELAPADGTRAVKGHWSVVSPIRIRVELPDRDPTIVELSFDGQDRLLVRDIAKDQEPQPAIPGLHDSTDWQATIEIEPCPPTLTVKGILLFRTSGFSARLQPSNPQGINPRILLLDLVVKRPTEPATDATARVPVEYTTERADLDEIEIRPLGVAIPVIEPA